MAVRVVVKKNNLGEIAAKLPVARRVILSRRGPQMVDIARQHSRVDTGEMRDSWQWIETAQGGRLESDDPKTPHHEWGTYKMSAAPMARPAAEQVFPLIMSDFESLERELR